VRVILWQSTLLELRVGVYEILDYCLDFAVGACYDRVLKIS